MKRRRRSTRPKDPDYREIKKKITPVAHYDPETDAVIYGRSGTGKTTFACTFPKPLLLLDISEKGTDSVRDVKRVNVIRVTDWDEIEMIYWFLKRERHDYRTIVFDTISQAQDLAIKKVMADKGIEVVEGELGWWGSMNKEMWGAVSSKLKTTIVDYRNLETTIIFLAQYRISDEVESEGDGVIEPEVGPQVIPSVSSTLLASVGIIGNTFIRETHRKIKIGKKIKKKRRVEYCLRIGPHAYYTTKIRKPRKIIVPQVLVDPSYKKIVAVIRGEEID